MKTKLFLLFFWIMNIALTKAQTSYPQPVSSDFTIRNFKFQDGKVLSELRLHYITIGKIHKDNKGNVDNAVLIMHGTTGSSHDFLNERFAGHLFGSGQLLDAAKYFIILTDAIGHGQSSKPSDGLHMNFPKYTYDDMVKADYELITGHLGVNHLRLVMGTSMGAMHTWVWGYTYPDFMDALMPLASLPVEIAGRNRILRKMAIDLIEMDPAWKNGEYAAQQPVIGLTGAISSFVFMVSSPLKMQERAPTREQSDSMIEKTKRGYLHGFDANNVIYALDASRFYDPSPYLNKIKAPLFAVNSADDEVNPPELGIMEREIKKVKKGRYILLPITEQTSGHGTHSNPEVWGNYLKELIEISARE